MWRDEELENRVARAREHATALTAAVAANDLTTWSVRAYALLNELAAALWDEANSRWEDGMGEDL